MAENGLLSPSVLNKPETDFHKIADDSFRKTNQPDPNYQNPAENLPRFDVPGPASDLVDTSGFSAGQASRADVAELAPPQDIDAATIDSYTPYEAVTGEVSEDATVQGRLSGLLSQDSDYIKRARENAKAFANRRGMLNSAMAAGAAEGAAIDRALPIAQQDARAFLEQQFLNQGYSNDAAKYLAEQSVQKQNLEAGFRQDTNQFNAARQFEADKLNQAAANRANEAFAAEQNKNNFARLSADLQAQLKGIDNELAMRLETLTREYGLLENMDSINGSIYQQMVQEMGSIIVNSKRVNEATGKINALINASGVEFTFSSGMTGGGDGSKPPGSPSQGITGTEKPPQPSPDHVWNPDLWMWERKVKQTGHQGSDK